MIPKKLPPLPPIRDLIRVYGLSANQKFSQNFILDKNVTDTIARHAKISVDDNLVVEVGPGPGLLTRSILDAGAQRVVVVEKDPRFLPALQQLSEASEHRLSIIHGDMLRLDHSLILQAALPMPSPLVPTATTITTTPTFLPTPPSSPTISSITQLFSDPKSISPSDENTLFEKPADESNETIRLLGNLPFGVASPLLVQWLKMMALQEGIFRTNNKVSMTLMFQKEVAEGIAAPPSHPQRSRLSILAQSLCDVKKVYKLSASSFVPKPKVDAAVVHFEKKQDPLMPGSLDKLEDVARFYFNKRRKTIGNITKRLVRLAPEVQPVVEEWIAGGKWDMNMRVEDVTTEQFCDLARRLDRAQLKIPLT
ncbi:Dimethyladenosine transferase 1, mitochondrial [Lobosporangium transversale]|uniref:rRNA adenine N(6)-methyltransferase n=1 Tax=Lobosporangium transversale TaxID=64571 RepID=A0A1Y2H0G2_9FUNG|nr:S-adenosyl-L-methionine-dependent methyltransferase [Lobosporangium transversale]KAF9913576.1 Dimethyladenosine transferase 1, mitochondrial [Lobosporangium transversale]ORZ28005.1 S-adenosyl-L-methionine-dependent methyltransferase [Lobosporangium transversale]|eukprot:XP_021885708.1 S-adenosyl-L-methionine-dependent methyltransferase [Lobosporangium transversale]